MVELSTFDSEVVSMHTCLILVTTLCYKLRMIVVPFNGPVILFEDNMSVVNSVSIPEY